MARAAAGTGETEAADRRFVVALARGLEVLRAFRPGDGMLGTLEIAQRTGLPKPTVSRLTFTLTRLGYLVRLERFGKYQIAPAALALGYSALAQAGIRHVARPYMQALADHSAAAVALGARDQRRMIYLEQCVSALALMVRLDVGSRIPIASSAMGRAMVAALPADAREALMAELEWRYGPDWPQLKAGIEQGIEDYARRGFVLSIGDWRPDINGVGVPMVMADGSGVYAFNCGAAAYALSRERLEQDIGPRLVHLVARVATVVNGGGMDEIGIDRRRRLTGGALELAQQRGGGGRPSPRA
jgi:DNA-binding IclR family transcriptional regulator